MGFVNPCPSWLGSWVGVLWLGLWCCPSFAGCLWCSWLGFGVGLLSGRVWFCAHFPCPPPFPVPVCGVGVRAGPGSRLGPALLGWVVEVCFLRFFVFFVFRLLGVPVPGLVVSPPVSFLSGWAAGFFFSFVVCVCLFWCPFTRWAAVPGLVLPVLAGWSPCACLGVLSSVSSGWGVWPPSVLLAGGLVAVGCFCAAPPSPPLFLGGGGGAAWLFLPLPSLGWRLLCGWCVVWLVPRHSWRRFLCATPRHSWLGFAAGGGGRSPPLLAGVCWRRWCVVCGVWCVVCGGGVLVGLWLVCGVVGPSPLLAEVPVCYDPLLDCVPARLSPVASMAPGDVCHGPRCSLAGLGPVAVEYCSCPWPRGSAGSPQCVRPMRCWIFPVPRPPYVCAVSWATWLLFTGVPAWYVALRVRCPGPLGSCSPVCPLSGLCRVCGVLGNLAPVHLCARSVCCFACAVSLATWLLFAGVPARCVGLRLRCPGPPGSCSPVCPLGVLCCVCGVLGHLAPVHRCARSVCCVACAVSWATWLLFTGAPARCVVSGVRCPGPPGSCSLVCPLGVFCCVCGVLGHLAPVHRCARAVCPVACAVSWATWLLFTGVPARCVVSRVRCPGPPGSCSPVCLLGVLCCLCGVLGHLAPVHRCARAVCCVACAVSWATWLLFTGLRAGCVLLRVRCAGPPGVQASAPPRENTRGRDQSRRQGPPPTHHSQGGPGTAPEDHRPKQRGKETEGGGHTKGAAGGHTTNRPQPGGAGNHTQTPRPRWERGHDTQPPHPHRAAKPSPERRGQAHKRTTNTPHTRPRMHTTHTATAAIDTSPTNAHHTPEREHRPHHKRTQHTKTQRTRTQQPPRQGSCRAARNTARTHRWTHQALSQE